MSDDFPRKSDLVLTQEEGGALIPRTAVDAALLGSTVVDTAQRDIRLREERRRALFDTAGHAADAFVEGVVDALSLGLVRDTSEYGETNRAVNAGWATAGEILGFGVGMLNPGGAGALVSRVARGGEEAGRLAARAFIKNEGSMLARGMSEATSAMALAGVQATAHQTMDALLEDKEFSVDAILDEVKIAGVMGAAGGLILGGLAKTAKKADVAAQGGLMGSLDDALRPHRAAREAFDEALTKVSAEVGMLKEAAESGRLYKVMDETGVLRPLSPVEREAAEAAFEAKVAAHNDAVAAKEALDALSEQRAFSGKDDLYYKKYRAASQEYRDAVNKLEESFIPGGEITAKSMPNPPLEPQGVVVERGYYTGEGEGVNAFPPSPRPGRAQPGVEFPEGEIGEIAEAVDLPPSRTAAGETRGGAHPDPAFTKNPKTTVEVDPAMYDRSFPDLPPATPAAERGIGVQARAAKAMEDLVAAGKGRLESAGSLGIIEGLGLKGGVDSVGAYADQLYTLRKLGGWAAEATQGKAAAAGSIMEGAIAGWVGHALGGTPGALAAVGADLFLRRGGRLAGASGRLAARVGMAAAGLLTSNRVRAAAAGTAAGFGNVPYAYSDRGPIEDPIERIKEIRYMAENPEAVEARVRATAEGLPEPVVQSLIAKTHSQLQALSIRAPMFVYDKLGRVVNPPAGKMRDFHEFENGLHNLGMLLDATQNGTITRAQADALRTFGAVHAKLTVGILSDPEALRRISRARLRIAEMVTGVPLTASSDPNFVARQLQAWAPQQEPAPQKPQAFNINPDGAPMPSQANASGRAPGN